MASKSERPTNSGKYNTSVKRDKFNPINKQLLHEFISYCGSRGLTKDSIVQYTNRIETFFVWLLENRNNKSFLEVTKKDIMIWQSEKVSIGKSSSNIRQIKAALSSLSKYIEDVCDDEYPNFKNIINKIPAPKLEYVRKKTYLPDSDFTMLKNELKNRGEWQKLVYLSLAYDSASRKSEVHQTLKTIDFENNETTIVRGKGGKKFTQPFSDETAEYIKKWLEVRGNDDCDKLFIIKSDDNVRPISKGVLNAWCEYFSQVYKELTGKDEWIYPHCFKSNRLSNLYHEQKVPLEIVQQYGHHSSPDVTLKSYIEQKSSTVRDIIFNKNKE